MRKKLIPFNPLHNMTAPEMADCCNALKSIVYSIELYQEQLEAGEISERQFDQLVMETAMTCTQAYTAAGYEA